MDRWERAHLRALGWGLVAVVGCGAGERSQRGLSPMPTPAPTVAVSSAPVDEAVAEPAPPRPASVAKVRPVLDPRSRAAHGMVLYLRDYARQLVSIDGGGSMTRDGCPTDISWVTWGVAKTDPWGNGFALHCEPGPAADPHVSSAGPDGEHGTDDDLHSSEPAVTPEDACAAACARATACASEVDEPTAPVTREALCGSACREGAPQVHFLADTCAQLDRCESVMECSERALRGARFFPPCDDFGAMAARAVGAPAGVVPGLVTACENAVLDGYELVCVASSTTAREVALCHLKVMRDEVEALLGVP